MPSSDDLAGLRDAAADAGVDAAPAAAHVRRYVDVDAILDDAARDPWNAKRSFAKEPPTGRKPVVRPSDERPWMLRADDACIPTPRKIIETGLRVSPSPVAPQVDAAALRAIVQTEARVLGASTEPKR